MSKEAMKLALEALELVIADVKTTPSAYEAQRQAITALREALAKPDFWEGYVPEPVRPAQQEPCEMGNLCIGCSPRNTDGSCPGEKPNGACDCYVKGFNDGMKELEQPAQQLTDEKGQPLKFWGGKAEQPAQQALDKKAENARELGLHYEPIQCPICKAEDSPYPKCGCVTYVEQPAQQEPVTRRIDMTELQELKLAYAECSRQRNELLNKLKSQTQRTWQGLTDVERHECTQFPFSEMNHRAIEAKLKEKNT